MLWDRARSKGFPLAILAIALNQARAKRYLGLGDIAADARFPRRGLAAGDGFATTLVQVYSLEPLELWSLRHPEVPLSLFIDDFLGSTSAPMEHQVVGRLSAAAADLQLVVENDMNCKVTQHKSVLVASNDRLLSRLTKAFGKFTGQASRSGSNLGVDLPQDGAVPTGRASTCSGSAPMASDDGSADSEHFIRRATTCAACT